MPRTNSFIGQALGIYDSLRSKIVETLFQQFFIENKYSNSQMCALKDSLVLVHYEQSLDDASAHLSLLFSAQAIHRI